MRRVLVLLSGGMDSGTLLAAFCGGYLTPAEGGPWEVGALSMNYGQRHARELVSGNLLATHYSVPRAELDIADMFKSLAGESALTNPDVPVPEGHYAEETMKATIVPNRNMILTSIAVGYAIANGYDTVAYAAHAGDHDIYPDCRKSFIGQLSRAIELCDWNPPALYTPFASIDKTDICAIGHLLGVQYSMTWTCYKGGQEPCGVCGACVERAEAFKDYPHRNLDTIRKAIPPWPTPRPLTA